MAFLLGSSSGASFGASSSSVIEQTYSPVFAEEIDLKYLYNLLPSFYRNFMSDQEVFTSVWNGMVPAISAETLNLWHINSAKSLVDIPTYTQRKWVRLPLRETEDFDVDPSLSLVGAAGLFSVDTELDELKCTWQNRGGVDSATKPLRGTTDQDCSVSWSFEFNLSSISNYGGLLVGYLNSEKNSFLGDSLAAGVVGSSSTEASIFILHASTAGAITYRRSSFKIGAGKKYRLTCTYSAKTTELVGSLVELEYEKISSTGTTGSDPDGDYYTNELTDIGVNFTSAGVVADDAVIYDGKTYQILVLESDTKLHTELDLLPSESSIPYTVVGEYTHTSLSMNIKADAGDYKFSSDSFGTAILDTQNTASLLVPKGSTETTADYEARFPSAYATAKSAKLVGITTNWTYTDPTSEHSIVYLPRIQNSYLSPSSTLYEHVDYSISDKLIKFQEPPPSVLYAEYVAYDEKKLYNNFGHLVGVGKDDLSSESLRSKIRAMFYAYFRGPTIKSIKTGVQIHLGLPIAESAGTVDSINLEYSGQYGQIVISGKSYLFPLAVGTSLSVGDSVEQFQVLCEGVEILDYLNSPRWFDDFSGTPREIEKFHMFLVRLDLDAFDVEDLPAAATFVSIIKPTWKKSIFLAFKELEDEVDIQDEMEAATTLNIYDSISLTSDAAFSGRFFDATPDSPLDPHAGAATEYRYGSYWVSGWLPGGPTTATKWGDITSQMEGVLSVQGSSAAQLINLSFSSDNDSFHYIATTVRDAGSWVNSFIEKKLTSENPGGPASAYYRIHIYSDASQGADHIISIDDTGITSWPGSWDPESFGWEDWSVDPSVGSEMVYTDEDMDARGNGGALDYDWCFDEGLAQWKTPALACARTAEDNTQNLLWRDTDSESYFLSGRGLLVEGHNRPGGSTEVPGSGDSFGVRSQVVGGNLIAEMGHLLESGSVTTVTTVSVPSGSTASSAINLATSGNYTSTSSSGYIPVTSAGGITDEPVWPTYVGLKWSSTSDWDDDGVAGTGYSYATFKVIQVASSNELIVDTSSAVDLPTSSDNIVCEVRRGGPLGRILYNGDLSNTDGCTTSDRDDFFVSSTGSLSSPDITNWGASGAPLHGFNTTSTTAHGVTVNALDDDVEKTPVYIAFRLISSSAGDLYYGENYDYSDWIVGTVFGYGSGGDEHRLHFKTYDMDSTWFTDDTQGMQWVMWKAAPSSGTNSLSHLNLHKTNSGTSCTVTAGSNFVELGEKALIKEFAGFQITQHPTWYSYVTLRPLTLSSAQEMVDLNIRPNDLVQIDCSTTDLNGLFRVTEMKAELTGSGGSPDVWPHLRLAKSETNFPQGSFTGTLYLTTTGTFTVYSRGNKGIEPKYGNAYKFLAGGKEYNVINKAATLPPDSPYFMGIQVDHVFSDSEDLGDWEVVSYNPAYSANAVFLHTKEYLSFAERFESTDYVAADEIYEASRYYYSNESVSYRASLIDNDWYGTYFDYYQEVSPDEEVYLSPTISPGAGNLTARMGMVYSPDGQIRTKPLASAGPEIIYDDLSMGGHRITGSFAPVLLGHLRATGTAGGSPAAAPYVAPPTGGSSPGDDLLIFEDADASFLSIPATSGVPDDESWLIITKEKSTGDTLLDWLPTLVPYHGGHWGFGTFTGTIRHARLAIVQVMEVLSDTQLLIRVFDNGEHADVEADLKDWWSRNDEFHWEIRDRSGVDPDRALITSTGVAVQADDITPGGAGATEYWDQSSNAIPGGASSGSGLPKWHRYSLTSDSIDVETLVDLHESLESNYVHPFLLGAQTPVYICFNTFRATLANGGTSLSITSGASEFNQMVKDMGLDGNPPYIQTAPTIFTTSSTTDPSVMLADSPVFKASVADAVDAKATVTIVGIPASPFTITFNDGSPTAVSISDGGTTWGSLSDVKNAIITAFAPHDAVILAGETYPVASSDALELQAKVHGTAGNSITLSTSDSSNITIPANLSGGTDATISVDSGTYAGLSVTDALFLIRATSNPFSISIGSASVSDWYGQSSAATIDKKIEEKVPTE